MKEVIREWIQGLSFIILILIFMFIMDSLAEAATVTCIHSSSLPIATGTGETPVAAWKKMVESCVMQQVEEFEKRSGTLTEERMLLFIDSCINKKCTKIIKNP